MVSDCNDYTVKGYCIRGKKCPYKHANDLIELDIAGYKGLLEAMQKACVKEEALSREREKQLKRKQADLLSSLICQQRALIKRIELCTDEADRLRLKTTLDQLLEKTKGWMGGGASGPAATAAAGEGASNTGSSSRQQPATAI